MARTSERGDRAGANGRGEELLSPRGRGSQWGQEGKAGQDGVNLSILSSALPTHGPSTPGRGIHLCRDPQMLSRVSPARVHPHAASPGTPHLDQLGAGHGQQIGHAGELGKELVGELLEAGAAQPLQQQPHAGPQLHPLRPVEAAQRGACGGRASVRTCRGTAPSSPILRPEPSPCPRGRAAPGQQNKSRLMSPVSDSCNSWWWLDFAAVLMRANEHLGYKAGCSGLLTSCSYELLSASSAQAQKGSALDEDGAFVGLNPSWEWRQQLGLCLASRLVPVSSPFKLLEAPSLLYLCRRHQDGPEGLLMGPFPTGGCSRTDPCPAAG